MSTETVSGAVAVRQKQDQLVDWIRDQQDEIAMVAATHIKPSAVVRVAHGALRRNPKLMQAAIANPQSLMYALLDAARLGHEPDTDDYYLVPFGNEVTGIEGYKGIIERMYRAGGVQTVVAEVVRQRDVYRPQGSTTPPVHEYDDFAAPTERGALRGAYAYALWPGGRCSQVIRMGRAEIMEHKAKSRGSDKADSPWQQWEPAMWKKTVLRALEPYVPTSTEYRHAPVQGSVAQALRAEQAAANGTARPAVPAADIVDAEIVEDTRDPGPAVPDETRASGPAAGPGPTPAPGAGGSDSTGGPATGETARPAPKAQPATPAAIGRMDDLFARLPFQHPEADKSAIITWICPRYQATRSEVSDVTSLLDDALKHAQGDAEEAASQIWLQRERATGGTDGN